MLSARDRANALRVLSVDTVEQANSGHPGAPLGMADFLEVLWHDFLNHAPSDPHWPNRDRFILSNGHASAVYYALLHLTGYDLTMDEIKQFRQLHSKTPGHPERGVTPGVEVTTGPLGQGLACGVGMAIAESNLAAHYNRDGFDIIDHYTYVVVGDGCLMEGISHECCSLAGTLALGKLIVLYDSNQISIDGDVTGWYTDDTVKRFESYGWQVLQDIDGHDSAEVAKALQFAKADQNRPTLIVCNTVIGWGAPNKSATAASHGAPLGPDEVVQLREQLGWVHAPFEIPDAYYHAWNAIDKGDKAKRAWEELFEAYRVQYPDQAQVLSRRFLGELPSEWAEHGVAEWCDQYTSDRLATRNASLYILQLYGPRLPELFGGSADLTGSNLTYWQSSESSNAIYSKDNRKGNYLHYGAREFAMIAINNGMAAYGGFIPYAGTFLVFSDYARSAIRMAALMRLKNIFVLTHDSIGLGEDGPTHQPIEHSASLRLIPWLRVWRPANIKETLVAWRAALVEKDRPTAILLSRQKLAPSLTHDMSKMHKGGYVVLEQHTAFQAIILASGSELEIACSAAQRWYKEYNIPVRVVSMPCPEIFLEQNPEYQEQVLPENITSRLAIEAGHPAAWSQFIGKKGCIIGITQFGESAPASALYERFGLNEQNVIDTLASMLVSRA